MLLSATAMQLISYIKKEWHNAHVIFDIQEIKHRIERGC